MQLYYALQKPDISLCQSREHPRSIAILNNPRSRAKQTQISQVDMSSGLPEEAAPVPIDLTCSTPRMPLNKSTR